MLLAFLPIPCFALLSNLTHLVIFKPIHVSRLIIASLKIPLSECASGTQTNLTSFESRDSTFFSGLCVRIVSKDINNMDVQVVVLLREKNI